MFEMVISCQLAMHVAHTSREMLLRVFIYLFRFDFLPIISFRASPVRGDAGKEALGEVIQDGE